MKRPRVLLRGVWIVVVCLAAFSSLGPVPRAMGASGGANLVLLNGKILTVNPQFSIAQAVAIQQGRFAAVGSDSQIRRYIGPATRVIDLHGRTVLPGLIDSHMHALREGLTWDREVHWDTVTSLAQGFRMLRDRAARTSSGGWVVVGAGWHPNQLVEKRLPTTAELDAAVPDHPVWVQRLFRGAVLNHAGLRALGITAETGDPPGGKVLKDASGQPTGVVEGIGSINAFYFKIPRPALEEEITSTRHWFHELNRVGLTTIGDVAGLGMNWPDDYRAVTALHDRGMLTVRVRWYMQPNRPGRELEVIRRFANTVRPGSGDDWFQPVGVGELLVASVFDGDAFGPLPPQFSEKAIDGWRQAVRMIIESGWRFQMHAVRDHTIEQLLPAIEEINREIPVAPRRIAFAHVEDGTPETMRRIKALGGGITVQDRLYYSGEVILRNWPEEVVRKAPPIKTMLTMGLPVGGGTDSVGGSPYTPFVSLWWMVTGKTIGGEPVRGPRELLSRAQALRAYTIGSAWFSFDEASLGSIEPGKHADLIVLSADYLTVPVDQIKGLVPVLTIVGGKPVYAAADYRTLMSQATREQARESTRAGNLSH